MALVGLLVLAVGLAGVAAANEAPLAEAGLDQDARVNSTVYIDAGGSLDPDGGIVAYEWEIERPNGTVTTPACRTCSLTRFVPRRPGRYNVTVTVTDDDGASRQDTMFVDVNGSPTSAPPSNGTSPPPSDGTGPGPGIVAPDPDEGGGSAPGTFGSSPVSPEDDQVQQEFDPETESQFVLENSELANGEDFVLELNNGREVRIPGAVFNSMANSQGQVQLEVAMRYFERQGVTRNDLRDATRNQCDCASRSDASGDSSPPSAPGQTYSPGSSDGGSTIDDPAMDRLRDNIYNNTI